MDKYYYIDREATRGKMFGELYVYNELPHLTGAVEAAGGVYLPESFIQRQATFADWLRLEGAMFPNPVPYDEIMAMENGVNPQEMETGGADSWASQEWADEKGYKRFGGPMRTKLEVAGTMVEAKLLIKERMLQEISDADFAYRLAEDANVRKTVNLLCQQVLQPTPVMAASRRDNPFINLGAGFSAYWNEMQKKLPIELENVAGIESVVMDINAGLDASIEPGTRRKFLLAAGMDPEKVGEFVTKQDYADYEARARENTQEKVLSELGLAPGQELSPDQQLAVEAMTEERVTGSRMQVSLCAYEPTFEDIYGISMEDMRRIFGDAAAITSADMEVEAVPEGYWDILKDTMGNNVLVYIEAEKQENLDAFLSATGMGRDEYEHAADGVIIDSHIVEEAPANSPAITDADLAFAAGGMPPQMITDADLAFAEQYSEDDDIAK